MKLIVSNRGSTPVTSVTSVTVTTSQGPRIRTFYNCPKCPCKFLSESDLLYHLYTHVKPRKKRQVKAIPSRKQTLKKYKEKIKAFRENYGKIMKRTCANCGYNDGSLYSVQTDEISANAEIDTEPALNRPRHLARSEL